MTDALAAELIRFAERLADESRQMLRLAAAEPTSNEVKADNSFVTVVDHAVEARLRELIEHAYPGHGIVGEEYGLATGMLTSCGCWTRSTARLPSSPESPFTALSSA